MNELAKTLTALPNLHPALVHFPIALGVIGLLVDSAALFLRKRAWLGSSATLLYVLAAVGGVATYLAGRQAADSVGQLSAPAEAVLAEHADLALLTVLALGIAAALRMTAAILNRRGRWAKPVAAAAILVMVTANALLAMTADHGGALVYRYGVAVALPAEPASSRETGRVSTSHSGPKEHHVTRTDDGALHWRPSNADGDVFHMVLAPTEGAPSQVLKPIAPTRTDDQGLWFEVSGETVVCFPETFGDVVVTATVDLGKFEGVFGLGHHVQSVGEGVFFTVTSKGEGELFRRTGGERAVMGQGAVASPPGLVTLRTSVAGRHLKGQVGDQTVAHGHGPSGVEGAVGLLLDGQGEVYITQVSVEPARDH